MAEWKPSRKVGGGALAIGVPAGVVIAWALTEFAGVNVGEPVAAAFGGLVSGICAYLIPER